MRNIFLCLFLVLLGCAQLKNGQEQPVIRKSAKEDIYFTSCAGAVEDWGSCYQKAKRTCKNGYKVISTIDNNKGTQRDLTFQCKK